MGNETLQTIGHLTTFGRIAKLELSLPKNIAILGSTGSIGCSTLDVVRSVSGFRVFGISGHANTQRLEKQAKEFTPDMVVASCPDSAKNLRFGNADLRVGEKHLVDLATHPDVDIVVAAIVGSAGLESTIEAAKTGKTIALANKETLVVAGDHVTKLAAESGTKILPVDSEHSAIFQAMQAGKSKEVSRIILTASGGPFREFGSEQLKSVSVEQALAHPTWEMGRKISIDSATMMNKALEVIEARWLFDMPAERIEVVVHPQSVIHSLVEFVDGSVIAQMSPPDMKLPIQYALTFPRRIAGNSPRMDLNKKLSLDLIPADFDRFPALKLGFEVAKIGGTAGAVLNAANEAAVNAFLNREISFTDIVTACHEILNNHNFDPNPNLDSLMQQDRWARKEISKWIAC